MNKAAVRFMTKRNVGKYTVALVVGALVIKCTHSGVHPFAQGLVELCSTG